MSDFKARASQLGKLMTEPKTKKAKEAGELSETAKSYLDEVALEKVYGRERPELRTKEIRKGVEVEEQAITALQEVLGGDHGFLTKNEDRMEDDHFTGIPDLLTKDSVFDTKAPWDLLTFHKAEPPIKPTGSFTGYYWQLQAYMALTGREWACLAYCFVDTPEDLVEGDAMKMRFNYPLGEEDPEFQKDADRLRMMHSTEGFTTTDLVKLYWVQRDDEAIDRARNKVGSANEYLKGWKL